MCACGCVRIQRHFVGYSPSRFVCLAVLLYLYDDLMNMNTVQGYMIVLIDKKILFLYQHTKFSSE